MAQGSPRMLVYLYATLGGAVATSAELLCTRMLGPFFGTGTDVWATVLASTLLGFASGYFLGARLVAPAHAPQAPQAIAGRLAGLYALASLWQLLCMGLAEPLMAWAFARWGTAAVIPVGIVVAMPTVAMLAATTPLLVQAMALHAPAGSATGSVVGLSTVGGSIGIFVFGFLLIPAMGVFNSQTAAAAVTTSLAALVPLLQSPRRWARTALALPLVLALAFLPRLRSQSFPDHIQYRQTGLLGELIVTDLPLENEYGGGPRRMILNNRIAQSAIQPGDNVSLWDYPHYIATLAGLRPLPKEPAALLLGQAGGTVARELVNIGFAVDAVDIDPRMQEVASLFFGLPASVRQFTDDARHYLNVCESRYDLIVYDLFAGEGQPSHVFSIEAFTRAKALLRPRGRIVVNYHGFWMGPEGLGSRSVARTLAEAGLHTYLMPTHGTPVERNLVIVGTLDTLPPLRFAEWKQSPCCQRRLRHPEEVIRPLLPGHYADGLVLRDDRPVLDQLNSAAYHSWRAYAIDHYLLALRAQGLHFY